MATELPLICNYDIFVSRRKNLILSSLANKPQAIVLIADAVACLTHTRKQFLYVFITVCRETILFHLSFFGHRCCRFSQNIRHTAHRERENNCLQYRKSCNNNYNIQFFFLEILLLLLLRSLFCIMD